LNPNTHFETFMIRLKSGFSQAILLALVISSSMRVWAGEPDVQILEASGMGYRIRYTPRLASMDTARHNGSVYQRVSFYNSVLTGNPGEPSIPCRTLILGVPDKGDVDISWSAGNTRERSSVLLVPVPEVRKEDGLSRLVYTRGAEYERRGPFPEFPAVREAPEWIGGQRIVRIHLYPVQFFPANRRIHIHGSLDIQVTFSQPLHPAVTPRQKRPESFLQRILVNGDYLTGGHPPGNTSRTVRRLPRTLSGPRYKIPVTQEGVYRITGSFLSDHGIAISQIRPETIQIFNNGGRELPRNLSDPRPDSLIQIPIQVTGTEDNRFDPSDTILFYGNGVTGWEYSLSEKAWEHYINRYTHENIYWLVFNDGSSGKRLSSGASPNPGGAIPVTSFREQIFLEQEINNPLNSGIHWYGPEFDNSQSSQSFTVSLSSPVPDDTLRFRYRFKGETLDIHRLDVAMNGFNFDVVDFAGTGFTVKKGAFTGTYFSGQNTLSFHYAATGLAPAAYLDWFEIAYPRQLAASDGTLKFFSREIPGIYDYRLSGFSGEPTVIEITRPEESRLMAVRQEGSTWAFTDSVDQTGPRVYMALSSTAYRTPSTLVQDDPSNLRDPGRGAHMVILAPAEFADQALRLKSHRESMDTLSVTVVNVEDVYDEFSWGLFDPTAIRDFMRYAFNNWSVPPSYLLLFGDGDYDYRNILQYGNPMRIPPFEFAGFTESGARASDDWYTYVSGNDSKMDLSVGRLPARTLSEAGVLVDKIIAYEAQPERGDWKTLITVVGDDEKAQRGDENETTHTRASEFLAENSIPPLFNFNKIYLTEYTEEITAEGRRKPQARDDLIDQINRGTLIVNFIGHGNEDLWAHERVFNRDSDLPRLENKDRLPLFYAATCAFGWFDNPMEQSFTEELMNTPDKGGIAVISATRFCSASPNEALNQAFMQRLFSTDGSIMRLGDALRAAKLDVPSTANNEMYHLFGDPSMLLGLPGKKVLFTAMDPDSLKALSVIRVEGEVEQDSSQYTEFTGTLVLKAFDAKKAVTYTTQYQTKLNYLLPGNAIFRGEVPVTQDIFQASFIVPKDISYGGLTGRLSCYAYNENEDAGGYRDNIPVGGSADLLDTRGPELDLSFSGYELFTSGGMVQENPELEARIRDDKTGINITGEIGHKIIMTLDDTQKEDITDYFQYDEGSYLQGKLIYPLRALALGNHSLSLKVWDNANNSALQTLSFTVVPDDRLLLEKVLNYPNPITYSTHFTFSISLDATVDIKIYTVDGRLIRHLREYPAIAGFNMIPWDVRDERGDIPANGVYLYKVIARTWSGGKNLSREVIGRLMIMR
jgi:hypothetical protein